MLGGMSQGDDTSGLGTPDSIQEAGRLWNLSSESTINIWRPRYWLGRDRGPRKTHLSGCRLPATTAPPPFQSNISPRQRRRCLVGSHQEARMPRLWWIGAQEA